MNEQQVDVHLAINTAPPTGRHRVSVWDDDGQMVNGPSCESLLDLSVPKGATFYVEASLPAEPKRNRPPGRDERRWTLRADAAAHAVLSLGGKWKSGPGASVEIRVDGAARRPAPRA
jgi:hypothetical protein